MSKSDNARRFYRKRVDFFLLIQKIKLWPSRTGVLHGIKSITEKGGYSEITTHCNKVIISRNSKNSRAARWIRNKWTTGSCPACKIPEWKLSKFNSTFFAQHYGSALTNKENLL